MPTSPSKPDPPTTLPAWSRMLPWALVSLLLSYLANVAQDIAPGNLVAITLYKAHLLALGGWGGYWLDRALFPYDRPHLYLQADAEDEPALGDLDPAQLDTLQVAAGSSFGHAMLRRAIVVAACLLCVGLGA